MDATNSAISSALARAAPAKRTHRHTWMPNNWLTSFEPPGSGLWGTQAITVGCPNEFRAVRLVFANISSDSYRIPLIKISPSAGWGDYVNPVGSWEWYAVTSANRGADVDAIVWEKTGSVDHLVFGCAPALPPVPSLYFTDWCAVPCETADPATGLHVLMIRLLADRGAETTFTNGMFSNYTGSRWTNGYDYFMGGDFSGVDHVTIADHMSQDAAAGGNLVNGSLVLAVQFLTKDPGIQGMNTGDSHHSGAGTEIFFNSYMMQLNGRLGKAHLGSVPFGFATAAHGGSTTLEYMAWLKAYLPMVQPSYCILPGWSFNDHREETDPSKIAETLFLPELRSAASFVIDHGVVPIYLTPFPRDRANMTPDMLAAWLWLRSEILAMRMDGGIVVDASTILGASNSDGLDGTYRDGFSTDTIHPNDAGHAAVAEALAPVVEALCGL